MIYDAVTREAPIRQGDIFRDLPRIDISLEGLTVLTRSDDSASVEHREMSWDDALREEAASEVTALAASGASVRVVRAVLPICPVIAIVITQDCDAVRAEDISLTEIAELSAVFGGAKSLTSVKGWVKTLAKQGTEHVRWFYLPPDASIGFSNRMAADFRSVLRLPRPHLEQLRDLRIGRLNPIAYEHFREKLAEFFRRYPYDPWYPLSKEEFEEYRKEYPESKPFGWQE